VTITTPTSQAALQEKLRTDPDFLRDLANLSDGERSKFLDEYDTAVDDPRNHAVEDIHAQLSEQLKNDLEIGLAELGRNLHAEPAATNAAIPAMFNDTVKGTAYNSAAPGAALNRDGRFRPADYVAAANTKIHSEAFDALRRESYEIRAAYTGTSGADGGLLVPEQMRSELAKEALEQSVVRGRAKVFPMTAGKVGFPINVDKSHTSTVFGGITATWEDEAAEAATSEAQFGEVMLEPKELIARTVVPNSLLADAALLEAFIMESYPEAIAYKEDDAFINGDGVKRPLGFFNADAMVNITRATASTIKPADIWSMYSRLLPNSKKAGKAVWITNQSTFPKIQALALDVGTGGAPLMTWNIQQTPGIPLLGLPVIETEKIPALGTAGDLMLVDLSKYLIGDRQALEMSLSEHQYHSTNKTGYRWITRVDGRPLLTHSLQPANGSGNLSGFIKLV
jgi:HK97 family phage major capsid protein